VKEGIEHRGLLLFVPTPLRDLGSRSAMATYFLRVKHVSRGKGARVTRAAAYRAGERIRDERTGAVYNFSNREDVAHKEIVLPSQLVDSAEVNWARDRAKLWNAAEHAGRRRDSRLAREVLVLLPPELTPAQRTHLVRTFSRELADKYRAAVDLTIHEPRPGADRRNHHAHLLMTTREVMPAGLGPRTILELGGRERHLRGLGPSKADYLLLRERWAQVTNEALREAGLAARIDHRSFKDQGIDRDPTPTIPEKIYYQERKSGVSTQAGDDIRARHRERVEARSRGGDELARVLRGQKKEEDRQRAIESSNRKAGTPKKIARAAARTRRELNQLGAERHHANKEAVNKRRRERYKENIEVERQKDRAWRQANAPQLKKRRQQWRKANADRVNKQARERWSKARERQQAAAKSARESALAGRNASPSSPPASAAESARKWLEFSASQSRAPTAEESARKWLEFSESQPRAPNAEESARKWLEFSERQKQTDSSQTPAEGRSHGRGFGGNTDGDDDDDGGKKSDRSRDPDYGL
jgi:hypothetical protein